MDSSGAQPAQGRASIFVPVELQQRGFLENPLFRALHDRAIVRTADGLRLVHPWIRWQDFSAQLDCIAYADRSLRALPSGRAMNPRHVTPGRLYTISSVILAHALAGNIAAWLGEVLVTGAAADERHFLNPRFRKEMERCVPEAREPLHRHESFVREMEQYRASWMHAPPDAPLAQTGVPQEHLLDEAQDAGAPHHAGSFTAGVFRQASGLYLDWLQFALCNVKEQQVPGQFLPKTHY